MMTFIYSNQCDWIQCCNPIFANVFDNKIDPSSHIGGYCQYHLQYIQVDENLIIIPYSENPFII